MRHRFTRAILRSLRRAQVRLRRTHVARSLPRVRHLVVHAPVPPGYTTEIGASLVAARDALLANGVVVIGPAEMREMGKDGWIGSSSQRDPEAFRTRMREQLASRAPETKVRAVVISSGRALGRSRLDFTESRRLRSSAESTLSDLIDAVGARRVTIVVELPTPERLRDEILCSAVEDGQPIASAPPEGNPHGDLIDRLTRIKTVHRVIPLIGGDASPANFFKRVSRLVGPCEIPIGARPSPRWVQRSILAASAVNPHLSSLERKRVHGFVRNHLSSEPSRRPLAAISGPVPPAALHVAPSPERLDLHLHVGLQKTATTTVQSLLHAARPQLAAQGVAYLGRRYMMRLKDLRAWRAYPGGAGADFAAFSRQLRRLLTRSRTVGSDRLSTVLVSNESIVGVMMRGPFLEVPFRPRAEGSISDLLDILQPDSCRLVLTCRRQDTLIESQYMWQIHGGESFGFERYLASLLRHPESLSYLDLTDRLARIPGVSDLTVLPYETLKQHGLYRFVNGIVAGTGASVDPQGLVFDAESNPSYSARALEIALAVNPHLTERRERSLVRDHLRSLLPIAEAGRASLLSIEDRARVVALFAEENRMLFRRWMPGYPDMEYSNVDSGTGPGNLGQPFSNSLGVGK